MYNGTWTVVVIIFCLTTILFLERANGTSLIQKECDLSGIFAMTMGKLSQMATEAAVILTVRENHHDKVCTLSAHNCLSLLLVVVESLVDDLADAGVEALKLLVLGCHGVGGGGWRRTVAAARCHWRRTRGGGRDHWVSRAGLVLGRRSKESGCRRGAARVVAVGAWGARPAGASAG